MPLHTIGGQRQTPTIRESLLIKNHHMAQHREYRTVITCCYTPFGPTQCDPRGATKKPSPLRIIYGATAIRRVPRKYAHRPT